MLACAVGGVWAAGLAALGCWASLALFGPAVPLPQWLVLRSRAPNAWWWVPLTAIGFLMALPVALMVGIFVVAMGFSLGLWVVPLPHSPGASPVEVTGGVLGLGVGLLIASVIAGAAAGTVVGRSELA